MNQEESTENQSTESAAATQLVVIAQLRRQLADLMRVDTHAVKQPPDQVIAFQGQIHGDTEAAFEQITERLATLGYTAMLQDQPGGGHTVTAIRGEFKRKPGQVWVNVALFLLTALSTLFVGALTDLGYRGELVGLTDQEMLRMALTHLLRGVYYAATIMAILVTHELSHYFVTRWHGSLASLPYFIPMPLGFGTMGAVIVQQTPTRNRKTLFDVGVAGPVGGLIITIPLLVLGLMLSSVEPPPAGIQNVTQEGNSLLYLGIKYLVFGKILPSNGEDVWLHPVASAAWVGLLVTMINLIPVGQLDGGHVSHALLGDRAKYLGYVAIIAMIAWGSWSMMAGNQGSGLWMTWGFLNMFLNPRHPPPLDDATRLDWRRVIAGLLIVMIFILLFMPAPLGEIQL